MKNKKLIIGLSASVVAVCLIGVGLLGDKLFHEHTWKSQETLATCINTGKTWEVCDECNEIQNEVELPALGHKLENNETLSTCTEDGKTWDVCKVCDAIQNEVVVPALEHKLESNETLATCTAEGKTWDTCSVCDTVHNEVIVPALGHTWESKENPATCIEDGKSWEECSVCDAIQNENVITALGHQWANKETLPTCTEDGESWEECSECNIIQNEVVLTALGHTWDNKEIPATCTEDGKTWEECSTCSNVQNEMEIKALNHPKVTKKTIIEPTYETEGKYEIICDVCKEIIDTGSIDKKTPKPTATPTPAPTKAPEKEVASGEVWNNVVENLINAGVAEEKQDYLSKGTGLEKPKTTWTFFNGNKDAKYRNTELVTVDNILIDSMHKAAIGLPTQYGIIVTDYNKEFKSALDPNMVVGIINKTTGEFVFTTVCNDLFYRESYGKSKFGTDLKFENGDSGMVTCLFYTRGGKFSDRVAWDGDYEEFACDFQIRFDEAIDTSEYTWFVTSCDMETWLANEDWYYNNSYTVVDDFYGNIGRLHTEGADIQFWEIKNNH